MLEHHITSMEGVESIQLHEPTQEELSQVIYHCHICMEAFVCEDLFRVHMDNHATEMPYECKVCWLRFVDEDNLFKHTEAKHPKAEGYEACNVCGKLFHDKVNLRSHMSVHSKDKPFFCGLCGRQFKRKGELETHLNSHTGIKPHKCDICNRAFTQKYSLKMHMRIHTGEKPFKCSICGKEFNRSSAVTLHMRQHNGEKPYNCKECDEKFKLLRDLKNHLAKVHGQTPKPRFRTIPMKRGRKPGSRTKDQSVFMGEYECAICKRGFKYVTAFNEHIKTHDVNSCYLCGQELKNSVEKRRHVTRPIELEGCECFTCGVKFETLKEFQLHMNGHTALCRLEVCLRNAERLHLSAKTSRNTKKHPQPTCGDSEDEDGNLDEYSDDGEDDTEEISTPPQKLKMDFVSDENGRPGFIPVAVKQEQFSGDEEPDTAILELVAGVEGFEVKTTSSQKSIFKKILTSSTEAVSNSEYKPNIRRQSKYKVSRVSPPRTRKSLKVRFKENRTVKNKDVALLNKNIISEESSGKEDEDSDDCDLAETYSNYVKNILRLQPVDKQMALIKCINTTIGQFIND